MNTIQQCVEMYHYYIGFLVKTGNLPQKWISEAVMLFVEA